MLFRFHALRIPSGMFLLALVQAAHSLSNHNLPLDRPYSLRLGEPLLLEREHSRMITGGRGMSFIFPRPCQLETDSSRVCGEATGFSFGDDFRNRRISVAPQAGYEFRRTEERAHAFEAGAITAGNTGTLSFYLDARMFTEIHDHWDHPSFDRELVDRQTESASGTIAYSSYSRYRGHLALDLPWGRLVAGRDAAHWGPALFANLSLNRESIPFDQISFSSHLGPISVTTLYGRLDLDSMRTEINHEESRSLYAHRYEWRATENLTLAISEQLVIYDSEDPFAFLPVVPLFILKGTRHDRMNNGNISADAAWRVGGATLVYGEFFIDDLQSPTSLFDDYWGNRWAWLAGIHWVHKTRIGMTGLVAEYSRVEPWVYAHYRPRTAQMAHGGYPLGNPLGPNSQAFWIMPYHRGPAGWTAWARAEFSWKGTDLGSSVADTGMKDSERKEFLRGVRKPAFSLAPAISFSGSRLSTEASTVLGSLWSMRARIYWRY